MFGQNIYRIIDQNNRNEIIEVIDTVNNKVVWERAIPSSQTPVIPTRNAPLLGITINGVCSQGNTPTPTAPVDILCNNGVLTYKDEDLPVGYKRITEIDFDGDTWYETGEALTGDDVITMTLASTSSTGQNVFGSYNGTVEGRKNFSLYVYGAGSSNKSYLRYNESLYRPVYGSGQRTITFGAGGTTGFYDDVSFEREEFQTPSNTYIGMLPNSSSPAYTGRIIGEITVGTRLKWIPCERESDGAIGYYEAVNGNFIAPSGTGAPTKGTYDETHMAVVPVGTQETVSVTATGETTQTATVKTLLQVGTYADTQDIISGTIIRNCATFVLDGTEDWLAAPTSSTIRYRLQVSGAVGGTERSDVVSSHFSYASSGQPVGGAFLSSKYLYLIPDQSVDTVEAFTTFLAAQYAAQTPVVVVYPLETETTEQVTAQVIQGYRGKTMSASANSSYVSGQTVTIDYYGKEPTT